MHEITSEGRERSGGVRVVWDGLRGTRRNRDCGHFGSRFTVHPRVCFSSACLRIAVGAMPFGAAGAPLVACCRTWVGYITVTAVRRELLGEIVNADDGFTEPCGPAVVRPCQAHGAGVARGRCQALVIAGGRGTWRPRCSVHCWPKGTRILAGPSGGQYM